jgi:hypothetical protein
VPPVFDGLPDIELFDQTDGTWNRFAHIQPGTRIAVAEPTRYVEPATGNVLIRLINESNDAVGFNLALAITGDVR